MYAFQKRQLMNHAIIPRFVYVHGEYCTRSKDSMTHEEGSLGQLSPRTSRVFCVNGACNYLQATITATPRSFLTYRNGLTLRRLTADESSESFL